MILRFHRTPPVQVQISRLKYCRRNYGVSKPGWWTFFAALDDVVEITIGGLGLGFFEPREQREPWEQDPDAWKR